MLGLVRVCGVGRVRRLVRVVRSCWWGTEARRVTSRTRQRRSGMCEVDPLSWTL